MGVKQEQILAMPLDKRNEKPKLFDNMHYADGVSFLDLALALGTIGMLIGSIYGFVLPLGPLRSEPTELFIMIKCDESDAERIEYILWTHHALGVGMLYPTDSPA